ncbi:MAG TPA: PRC-barrel domain-containing protein [Rubrobacteraceae bacterium]|nr:PRC-barrel domain-containing protein [Rubrobacteraceae bacterium]
MERSGPEPHNPYTALLGYTLLDASGEEFGRVDDIVYDAPTDVLKYVVSGGHTIPADEIEVDPDRERVHAPYERETIESAPTLEDPSGAFDERLREHYSEPG